MLDLGSERPQARYRREIDMSEKTWNFTVVATSLSGQAKFFGGGVNDYEDALTLQSAVTFSRISLCFTSRRLLGLSQVS